MENKKYEKTLYLLQINFSIRIVGLDAIKFVCVVGVISFKFFVGTLLVTSC